MLVLLSYVPMSHVGLSERREFCMDLSWADTTLSTSIFIRLNSSKHPLGDKRLCTEDRGKKEGKERGREGGTVANTFELTLQVVECCLLTRSNHLLKRSVMLFSVIDVNKG